MKVVKALEDEKIGQEKVENTNIEQEQTNENKTGYIRLKKFHFIGRGYKLPLPNTKTKKGRLGRPAR